jgi:hypothetical protein
MKKAYISALVLCLLLSLLSCGQKTASPQIGNQGKASSSVSSLVSNGASGFCILAELALYDMSGANPKGKATLQLGEKLALLGQTMNASLWGKPREFAQVRRDTGEEGWALYD